MRLPSWPWILLWCCGSAALGVAYAWLPASPDQAIFDYVGWIVVGGGALYRDVAEQNFPGIMWLHAGANWLFGNHAWSFRALDYLLLLPFCWLLVRLARRVCASQLVWLVAPLYQLMYVTSGIWSAGCRDLVAAHALVAAGCCYVQRAAGRSAFWLVVAGVATTFAVLVRPTYALFPVLMAAADAWAAWRGRRSWRAVVGDVAVFAATCIVLLGGLAAVGAATGQLQEWYGLAVRFNVGVYSHSASLWSVTLTLLQFATSWHWYLAYGAAGCWLWWRSEQARGSWFVLVAAWTTAIVSAYAQRKGFGYHFVGMLPALGVFSGYFLLWVVARVRGRSDHGRLLVAAIAWLVALVGLLKKCDSQLGPQAMWLIGRLDKSAMLEAHGYADTYRVADLVASTVDVGGRVLVWSRAVHVNYVAERRSPTRFITVWMLDGIPEDFTPGRAWIDEFAASFQTQAPEVIVLDAPSATGDGVLARSSPSRAVRILADEIERHYRFEANFGSLDVYRRRRDR